MSYRNCSSTSDHRFQWSSDVFSIGGGYTIDHHRNDNNNNHLDQPLPSLMSTGFVPSSSLTSLTSAAPCGCCCSCGTSSSPAAASDDHYQQQQQQNHHQVSFSAYHLDAGGVCASLSPLIEVDDDDEGLLSLMSLPDVDYIDERHLTAGFDDLVDYCNEPAVPVVAATSGCDVGPETVSGRRRRRRFGYDDNNAGDCDVIDSLVCDENANYCPCVADDPMTSLSPDYDYDYDDVVDRKPALPVCEGQLQSAAAVWTDLGATGGSSEDDLTFWSQQQLPGM